MRSLRTLALLALAALLPAAAVAQDQPAAAVKPVAAVSVASLDELVEDIRYVTRAAGMAGFGELAKEMAGPYSKGLDRTKPSGALVLMEQQLTDPVVVGFLPATDIKAFLALFEQQIGKPIDRGNGLYELDTETPVYVLQQPGWAFFGRTEADVRKLAGADPVALLGDLPKQYDVAVRIYANNVPADLRELLMVQVRTFIEQRSQEQLDQAKPEDRKAIEEVRDRMLTTASQVVEELDQFTVGLTIDREKKTTHLEYTVTADEGTNLAKRMALTKEGPSKFAGFMDRSAAFALNGQGAIAPQDAETALAGLAGMRKEAMKEIEKDDRIPDAQTRQEAKRRLGAVIDQLEAIVKGGRLDAGASLFLKPESLTFLAGFFVPDGPAFEKAIMDLVDLAKQDAEFPEVQDAGEHAGVRLRQARVSIPADKEDARQLFGEELEVTVGFGAESAYLALGRESLQALKAAIDQSTSLADQNVPPTRAAIGLAPIGRFVATKNDDPATEVVATTLENSGGKDHINITVRGIERGVAYRLELEDGVLQTAGQLYLLLQTRSF